MEANLKETKEDIKTKIEDNNEKFEIFRDTLVSLIDANQAKMDMHLERMEAAIHSMRAW
jgi:hypothetical protein